MPDWPTSRLEDVADILDYMRRPVNASERQRRLGSVPYYGATGVAGWIDTPLFDETLVLLGEDAVDFGNPLAAKAYLVRGPSWVNNHAHVLRAGEHILPEFLTYALNLVDYANFASFGTRSKLTQANMRRIEVPVPPVPEQRRIVDVVDALDVQISALDRECEALGTLVIALREALVAGATWEPVGNMVEPKGVQIGPFGSQLHAHEYSASGVPVVMPQDLQNGEIQTTKIKYIPQATAAPLARHRLRAGDVILPRRGDLTKRALVKPEQEGWLCGTGCIRIRLADPSLAPALLEGLSNARTDEWLTTNAVGTTMLNLNTEIVSKLPAPSFSDSERGLAETCIAAQATLKTVLAERETLTTVRQQVVAALVSADIELPPSYDSRLARAV